MFLDIAQRRGTSGVRNPRDRNIAPFESPLVAERPAQAHERSCGSSSRHCGGGFGGKRLRAGAVPAMAFCVLFWHPGWHQILHYKCNYRVAGLSEVKFLEARFIRPQLRNEPICFLVAASRKISLLNECKSSSPKLLSREEEIMTISTRDALNSEWSLGTALEQFEAAWCNPKYTKFALPPWT
jgi:hypothetical protein